MKIIKNVFKKIINIPILKNAFIFMIRHKLIHKRFRNLIQLKGFYRVNKSKVEILNDKNDAVSRDLCIFGIPEKEEVIFNKFISEVKNAKSFLDIGAGIGLYTLFAVDCNNSLFSLSLEPNPKVFLTLRENLNNLSLNRQNQVILNKAVSSQEGSLEFFVPTGDDFSYGTSNKSLLLKNEILYKSIFVETTNLSEFHNQTFEIIKIDVEGSELDVLRTISNHLEDCKFVFIEIMLKNRSQVYELLKNYRLTPIRESKEDIGNYIFQKE